MGWIAGDSGIRGGQRGCLGGGGRVCGVEAKLRRRLLFSVLADSCSARISKA